MVQKGDLVTFFSWENCEMVGIVLDVEPMKDIYRDSNGTEPIYSVTVLFEKDVPMWLGEGRICTVSDVILKVIQ